MSKEEILDYFKDINHAYNDCTKYDTLKRMLDELQDPFMNKPCVAHQICHEDKVKVLDKLRSEIESTLYVDSLIFGELMDFKEEKISADDVIEEFNQVTRKEVLGMIDKYSQKGVYEK